MSAIGVFDSVQLTAIAEEVFAAMVDGEPGHLQPWWDGPVAVAEPVHAWVDLHASYKGRVLLTTDAATADDLARALLGMGDGEPVSEADLIDAFGEVANVVGGNLKALLPEQGRLTMPVVSWQPPAHEGATQLDEVLLAWRGRPLVISVWNL